MATQTPVSPFAYGTVKRPVPLDMGARLSYQAGTTKQLAPIAKSGFLAALKYEFNGTVDVTTPGAVGLRVPFERIISNYKLSNSLGYEYRSLDGDGLYFKNQIESFAQQDPVVASPTYRNVDVSSAGVGKPFSFCMYDRIAMNEGINFDRYLLSAQTLDNDLSISMTYAGDLTPLQGAVYVLANLAFTVKVSAVFYTVPDTSKYALPDTSIVQQVLTDPTFTTVVAGDNYVNLLPIQGPEFLGVGLKLTLNNIDDSGDSQTNFQRIRLIANGLDPIMDWTASDLIQAYFERFGRRAPAGWIYLDFTDDISLPNAMGPVERNVFSTQAYSQLTLQITQNGTPGAPGTNAIKLFKRMQSEVAA